MGRCGDPALLAWLLGPLAMGVGVRGRVEPGGCSESSAAVLPWLAHPVTGPPHAKEEGARRIREGTKALQVCAKDPGVDSRGPGPNEDQGFPRPEAAGGLDNPAR